MKISLFLADAAQADAQSGKVHALGLGWRQCQTPTPPFSLVLFLDIDWDETNKQHKLTCRLLTTDGGTVVVMGAQGPQPISFEAAAEAGRRQVRGNRGLRLLPRKADPGRGAEPTPEGRRLAALSR